MKERNILGICKCCNKQVSVNVNNEDVDYNNLTLESYKKYKDFMVSACPNCGYIADDIFNEKAPKNVGEIVNSLKYKNILNYGYIISKIGEGPWNYELEAFNPNYYEAYSLILDDKKDYENEIKALFKTATLKQKLIKYMRKKQYEDAEEAGFEDEYEIIYNSLTNSLNENIDKIEELYKKINSPNKFTTLIYIESLILKQDMQTAYKKLMEFIDNVELEQGLKDYLLTLFS